MVFVIKFKGLPPLSGKNAIWLVMCVFIYACLLIHLMSLLATFADSMGVVCSVIERQAHAKNTYYTRLAHMKYILHWERKMKNFNSLNTAQCNSTSNCYFTGNRALFSNYTYFDAILFDQSHFKKKWTPIPRSSEQLYIFTTEESPSLYPACGINNDEFFNWTFTYRLDSDIVWKLFVVRNLNGNIVAPNLTVKWNTTKHPVNTEIKAILQGKTKAAAWIVNDCKTMDSNDQHLNELRNNLIPFSLQIDIYGNCTKTACGENGDCKAMVRKHYYFYIAFDNSLDDDYVTQEVLHGYNNYAVPIVYGGADYSRFLPPTSYIDARQFHPHNLAKFMNLIMKKTRLYESYFSWTNLYTIDSKNSSYNPACELCEALNSEKAKYVPAKKNFRNWWNKPSGFKSCLPDEFWIRNRHNISV